MILMLLLISFSFYPYYVNGPHLISCVIMQLLLKVNNHKLINKIPILGQVGKVNKSLILLLHWTNIVGMVTFFSTNPLYHNQW